MQMAPKARTCYIWLVHGYQSWHLNTWKHAEDPQCWPCKQIAPIPVNRCGWRLPVKLAVPWVAASTSQSHLAKGTDRAHELEHPPPLRQD